MDHKVYKTRFWWVEATLLLVAVCFALGVWISGLLPFEMRCLSVTLFGLYCPVCGGTRSLLALFQGEVWTSFVYFPPLFVILPVAIWLQLRASLAYLGKGDGETVARSVKRWGWILLGVLLVHFAIRTLLLALGYDPLGDLL